MAKEYFVYIMASRSRVLYVGVTSDLEKRVYKHKFHVRDGFTARYRVERLVFYETTSSVQDAIAREKQIKGWLRAKKAALIESENSTWSDLSDGWFEKQIRKLFE